MEMRERKRASHRRAKYAELTAHLRVLADDDDDDEDNRAKGPTPVGVSDNVALDIALAYTLYLSFLFDPNQASADTLVWLS